MSDVQTDGIGAVLGDAGAPVEITHAGKTWKVGAPTQAAKTVLEQLVVQVSMAALDEMKTFLPAGAWEEKRAELDAQLFGRHWQTWGKLWTTVSNGPLGLPLFLLSLLRANHPTATVADAEEIWQNANRQARIALTIAVPSFFALLSLCLPAEADAKRHLAEQTSAAILASLALPTLTA